MHAQLHARKVAGEFFMLADLVTTLAFLEPHNHVGLSQSRGDGDAPEIDVHECTPEQLELVLIAYPRATEHRDADSITRRITAEHNGAELTFYRR